jgi:hypothetical protein
MPAIAKGLMDQIDNRTAVTGFMAESEAECLDRIVSLRGGVALMRSLATRSRAKFHEHLLALARDMERHVMSLEIALTKDRVPKK